LALRKRNFNRAGTETRPYPPKITDNRQIFTEFVEATRQLSVVAPKLVKIRIAGNSYKVFFIDFPDKVLEVLD
jgi:hypothetical protein